jgi:hypothetical protein
MLQKNEITQLTEISTAQVDPLKHLYTLLKDKGATDGDMIDNDVTELYHKAKVDKLKNGELWVEQIKGEVRTGKSTVGFKEILELNEIRYRLGLREQRVHIMDCIAADQTEAVRIVMRHPRQQAIMIDEYSAMAEGGANSSTEQQTWQSYGDMLASDYVDRVNCNPTRMLDTNAFIHLIVIGKIFGGYTRCQLKYVNNIEGDQQTLGYVDIYVWDIIENWTENVRPVFEKEKRTKQEELFIEEQARTDPYVAYMLKKERRQKLMTEHHIRDIRELEFAKVTLRTVEQLNPMAATRKTKIPDAITIALVQDICKETGVIYSFYAETVVVNKVKSIILLVHDHGKLTRELLKPGIDDIERGNIWFNMQMTKKLLKRRLDSEARFAGLYDQYTNIQ